MLFFHDSHLYGSGTPIHHVLSSSIQLFNLIIRNAFILLWYDKILLFVKHLGYKSFSSYNFTGNCKVIINVFTISNACGSWPTSLVNMLFAVTTTFNQTSYHYRSNIDGIITLLFKTKNIINLYLFNLNETHTANNYTKSYYIHTSNR